MRTSSSSSRRRRSRSDNSAFFVASPPSDSFHKMNSGQSNVFRLLAQRELSPQTKRTPKRFWGKGYGRGDSSGMKRELTKDARQELRSWAEAESLLHLSAKYCSLMPPPRSTIAAAFSSDGKTLASTHGDHTVKIIDCQTGTCLKVLSGHRRTPWVVRFHPLDPEYVASGSLDHEVRLWNARTAECIGSRDFYRPIASIAFHAQGEILAVASGHKLYIWHYERTGETSSPTIILRTRRSLRAVHFHPHGAPFLLTAEVNDLDASNPTTTLATTRGHLRYPPPDICVADANPSYQSNSGNELSSMSMPFLILPPMGQDPDPTDISQQRADSSTSVRLFTFSTEAGQYELVLSPIQSPARDEPQNNNNNSLTTEIDNNPISQPMEMDGEAEDVINHFFSFSDMAPWELPFLQGWLIGQSQAGQRVMQTQSGGPTEGLSSYGAIGNPLPTISPLIPNVGNLGVGGRSGPRNWPLSAGMRPAIGSSAGAGAFNGIPPEQSNSQPPFVTKVQPAADLPCTVKLRIWSHDVKNPCEPLESGRCRLTISHAVLCSEMGAHFSPCGRFLAACVACILPNTDTDPGLQGQVQHDVNGLSTSPTRHPILTQQLVYELRIYSLEEATFGCVLASRAIRAAHCLTSIQFSPTSEHLLLAYGRRHPSLLKSIVLDGPFTEPIYTILEIYRVSDMELVGVLPSKDDEVNVASFHPSVGGGFIYGTKEGKLRILQCESSHGFHADGSSGSDDRMPEAQAYAIEE